jgi:hypothetical protein
LMAHKMGGGGGKLLDGTQDGKRRRRYVNCLMAYKMGRGGGGKLLEGTQDGKRRRR